VCQVLARMNVDIAALAVICLTCLYSVSNSCNTSDVLIMSTITNLTAQECHSLNYFRVLCQSNKRLIALFEGILCESYK
jgi:hypothetical protein